MPSPQSFPPPPQLPPLLHPRIIKLRHEEEAKWIINEHDIIVWAIAKEIEQVTEKKHKMKMKRVRRKYFSCGDSV